MRELALFAGAGGGILGGILLGWRTVCAIELDPYCRSVLLVRQRDGMLGRFPIWDDVRTFDGRPWRSHVDVISGGFPCQDISVAGKQAGINGAKSGLWKEFARIIEEVAPSYVFIENSPNLRTRGLVRVLKDLTCLGFNGSWGVLGASDVGAPHRRRRMWIAATHPDRAKKLREQPRRSSWTHREGAVLAAVDGLQGTLADDSSIGRGTGWPQRLITGGERQQQLALCYSDGQRQLQPSWGECEIWRRSSNSSWWSAEPDLDRVAYGVAYRMDRLRALGNGQVPLVAATAWEGLSK